MPLTICSHRLAGSLVQRYVIYAIGFGDDSLGLAFDIGLLLIFILFIILGAYRGAVRTILGIAAFILAGFLAVRIGVYLAPEIYDRFFAESISQTVQANLPSTSAGMSATQQAQAALNALPEPIRNLAVAAGVDLNAIQAQLASYQYSSADIAQNIEGSIIAPIVTTVFKIFVTIASFVLLYIILRLLICLIDRFFNLPVLSTVNRVVGGLLGAVRGLLAVAILGFVIVITVGMFCEADSTVSQAVAGSKLLGIIQGYNPIGELF